MNIVKGKRKKDERWFTFIDALIIIVAAGLITSAVILFALPGTDDTAEISFEASLIVDRAFAEAVKEGDRIICGGEFAGRVEKVTVSDAYILVPITLENSATKLEKQKVEGKRELTVTVNASAKERDDGFYLGDEAVRVNDGFELRTATFSGAATVRAIRQKALTAGEGR